MNTENTVNQPFSSYQEVEYDNTVFRVTSVFMGEIDLKSALEDLTVRRVARKAVECMENA